MTLANSELRKPKTRAGCSSSPRPCPFASCRFNLTADVNSRGEVREVELVDGAPSCVLDVVESSADPTLDEVGGWLGLEGETVRGVELAALAKFKRRGRLAGLEVFEERPAALEFEGREKP